MKLYGEKIMDKKIIGKKISIITISYNSINTIEKTFKSVLAQTYRPLEYVLVDGESKDGTIALIERYISKFQVAGIEVNFKSEPDRGISDAFNKGIARTTGEIIGIINSDDQLMPESLKDVMQEFERSESDIVCGDCLWVDEENGIEYIRKSKMQLDRLKYEMVLMHPSCFVKKSAYEKYGVFDTNLKFVMDKDLMARFYKNGAKFSHIPKVLTRMSAGGASDANAKKVYIEGVTVAVSNGVPRWFAEIRWRVMAVKAWIAGIIKKNKTMWSFLRKNK